MDKKEYFYNLEIIRENVSREDRLLQLAEECNELAQAILKVCRLEKGSNKPQGSKAEVYVNLYEEMADVKLCMSTIENEFTDPLIQVNKDHKLARWVERVKGVNETCKN